MRTALPRNATLFLLIGIAAFGFRQVVFAGTEASEAKPAEKTATELFSVESDYIGKSKFREGGGRYGSQSAVYNDFSYGHRFALFGQWYLRTGVEYERYDFSSSRALVPSKLQALSGTIAVEYVEQGYAGAGIELHPGVYYENNISTRNFDMPWDVFATIPFTKKFFVVVGATGASFYRYPILPIGGAIWLITERTRLEAVFPKAGLVFNQSEAWEFRLTGELTGGGFHTDKGGSSKLDDATLEYYDSRAGGMITYSGWKPFDIVLGAGYVFERSFDFYRVGEQRNTHGAPYVKIGIDAEF